MRFILITVPFFLFPAFAAAQNIHFVKPEASGNADGSTWENAFPQLQQALAVAQNGDEIWVATGTYKPSTSHNRFHFFQIPNGVAVYGGFKGDEALREQRNWAENPCILSGDIGVPGDSTDNSFNIVYANGASALNRLDGFVLEEGNANHNDPAVDYHRPTRSGGAIYLDGEGFGHAQLQVANCHFRRNRAQYQGGAVYANGRDEGVAIVRLDNCIFEQNLSKIFGGALSVENYFLQPYALEIKACVFRENRAGSNGDAIWMKAHQAVSFSDCKFLSDYKSERITVLFTDMLANYPLTFEDCVFEKSTYYTILYFPAATAENDAHFRFRNCTFSGNYSNAFYLNFFSKTKIYAQFEQCRFLQNWAHCIWAKTETTVGEIRLTNCLFYQNQNQEIYAPVPVEAQNTIFAGYPQDASPQIFASGTKYRIANCLFTDVPACNALGGTNLDASCDTNSLFGLNLDPLFINPEAGIFQLQACSPAINAGNNDWVNVLDLATDLNGNPRIGNSRVDLGPYETLHSIQPSVSVQSACAGDNSGAFIFETNLCEPVAIQWNNGDTIGTNQEGLAAGIYAITATGANGVQATDTLVISEPLVLLVDAKAHNLRCHDSNDGWIEAIPMGGTSPYTYDWGSIGQPSGLVPGTYIFTVTDAAGCSATGQATVETPLPIEVVYTVNQPSCSSCSDGSIVFDTIWGGFYPPMPASKYNLPAGNYTISITDLNGCTLVLHIQLGGNTGTNEMENFDLNIFPNPAACGEITWFEWPGNVAAQIRISNAFGKIVSAMLLAPNDRLALRADWPPGVYWLEISTTNRVRRIKKWVLR